MTSFSDPKADWLNTVVHDLKTPINSVRGCIDLIQNMGPLNEKQEYYAERAFAGLKRMEHLVSRLLDISWLDSDSQLEWNDVNLPTLIDEAVDLLKEVADQRSITVKVQLDKRLGTLRADSRRLALVMDNLLSNAIKYNQDNGSVTLTAVRESDAVRISVQDTGIGISADDLPHVFDRFFRSRQGMALRIEGSGLGLALTKGIVQRHQGRIWVESKQGEGSIFTFTLPVAASGQEGRDGAGELLQNPSEDGRDGKFVQTLGFASEASDSVDDDLQENRDEMPQTDSSGDEI